MVNRAFTKCRNDRAAVTLLELLVSVTTLVTVMTLTTTLCFQIQRTWQDIRQHQVAVGELSNQLEHLTQLNEEQFGTALEQLTPSATCERTLRQPKPPALLPMINWEQGSHFRSTGGVVILEKPFS